MRPAVVYENNELFTQRLMKKRTSKMIEKGQERANAEVERNLKIKKNRTRMPWFQRWKPFKIYFRETLRYSLIALKE